MSDQNFSPSTSAASGYDPKQFGHVAPDTEGLNFFDIDQSLQASLRVYASSDLYAHFQPIMQRFGEVAGGELDRLSRLVDKNPPVLEQRDRFGRRQRARSRQVIGRRRAETRNRLIRRTGRRLARSVVHTTFTRVIASGNSAANARW